ncbi:MAG TPA: A24 family peptidase [Pararobbsia sp.]|nr:A24 family peptidase [Pararobbsia sp.]
MLNGLFSLFDGLALLPAPAQYVFVIAFGLVIGSFVTVVVHRLPIMLERDWQATVEAYLDESQTDPSSASTPNPAPFNLMRPGSRCDSCGHALRPWENVPVLSYVLLRGRCSACRTPIPARYALIEVTTGLLAALSWWRFGPGWAAVFAFAFAATSLALTCIDWQTRLLPDSITLPLLWAGLLVNLGPTFTTLTDAVIGAAAGYAFLWIIYWGFWWLRRVEGIGLGDLKLFAAIGAWLGWTALVQVLVLASLSGAVVGLALLALHRLRRDEPLPFGPFLAIAACITLFAGTPLWPTMALHVGAAFGG